MSNLANQQINSSFQNLLQIPGGITNTLQTVQDGNGNNTGLQISSTGINGATITNAIISNNGTSYANAVIRPISDMLGDVGNVKDFGATGNGVTNDYTALLNANNSLSNVIFSPGTYYIASNITFTKPVFFLGGASLVVAAGVTVTFNNSVNAPTNKIFSLGSSANIKFNGSTPLVYPDWWGTANDNSIDDAIPVQAAINSLSGNGGVVQFLPKHYYLKSAISVTIQSLTLRGTTTGLAPIDYGSGGPWGTQLVGTNGINCITVTNIGYFKMQDINMYVAVGATTACIGLNIVSCFYPKIDDCRITNFSTAIKLTNTTDPYISRCYLSSTGSTVSPVISIDVDGSSNQQNPSVFLFQNIAAHGSYSGSAYGYYMHGNRINDLYVDNCEASGCSIGFYLLGSSITAGYGADIHFRGCSSDGNAVGYSVVGVSNTSACNIVNGWSASSVTGVNIEASSRIRVSGMQIYGGQNGVYVNGSDQSIITDNTFLYQSNNSILISSSSYCTFSNNQGTQAAASACSFINAINATSYNTFSANVAYGPVAGSFVYGIVIPTSDYACVVGNSMPTTCITTPYTLDLPVNTNSYFAGTGVPN